MSRKPSRYCLHVLASLSLAASSVTQQAAAASCSNWVEVTTDRFHLYANVRATKAIEIAESLNTFQSAVEIVTNADTRKSDVPLNIIVYDPNDWVQFLDSHIVGLFNESPFENLLLIQEPAGLGNNPYMVAMHEYVHFVLHSQTGFSYPAWYDEGLADVLSAAIENDDTFRLGFVWRERLSAAKNSIVWEPLKQLLTTNQHPLDFKDPKHVERYYVQAMLLTHYLLFSETRGPQLKVYLKELNEGTSQDKAFEKAFGTSYEQLDAEVREYSRQKDFPSYKLPKAMLAPRAKPVAKSIPCEQGLVAAGHAMLRVGADAREVSKRYFREESASSRLARAEAALRAKDLPKATSLIDQVLAMPNVTGTELLTAAELLISQAERPANDDEKPKEADKELLLRAQSILARNTVRELKTSRMAYLVVETALHLNEQVDDALEVAFQGVERAPRNSHLAEVTAILCELKGDYGNAAGAWSIVATYARESPRRKQAKERLAEIDAWSKKSR